MSQIDCPTPHIHTEIELFTSCVITLIQNISLHVVLLFIICASQKVGDIFKKVNLWSV